MNSPEDNTLESRLQSTKTKLHKLKMKNAITRQETMKAEKERAELKNGIKKSIERISAIKSDLERDEQLLQKGSKVIASAECIHLIPDIDEKSVERIKNINQWIILSSRRFETELSSYNEAYSIVHLLCGFPTMKSVKSAISLLTKLSEIKEESMKKDQEFFDLDMKGIEVKRKELEKLKETLVEQQIKDQKNKLLLDSFIRRFGGGCPHPSAREFSKGENAIQAAEAIVHKLKSKLNTVSDFNQPRPQTKRNVLHFDLRGCQ